MKNKKLKAALIVLSGFIAAIFLPYLIGSCYTYDSPIHPFGIWMFGAVTIMGIFPFLAIGYNIYKKLSS